MTDFDKEIRELEAQIRSLKTAKEEAEEKAKKEAAEKAKRTAEAKKVKDKIMHDAVADIGEGIIYLKKGFSKIMSKEDFELISDLFLNETIIPICFDLVNVCNEPFFKPIIKSIFNKTYDNTVQKDKPHITITSKNISEEEVEDIIQSFIESLGD